MERDLILVGCGGFAREVLWLANRLGRKVVGFLDDFAEKEKLIMGVPVLGKVMDWKAFQEAEFIVAIGNPISRKNVICSMLTIGTPNFAILVDPSAIVAECAVIGEGSVICAGVIVTVNVKIGRHVIINLNSTLGHDTNIGCFTTIAPIVAISGNVSIGESVEIGTGAAIREKLTIVDTAIVGMGGVLVKSVTDSGTFVGNPAKPTVVK